MLVGASRFGRKPNDWFLAAREPVALGVKSEEQGMRVLIVVFSVMLVTLQYRLWIGDSSFPGVWKLEEAVAAQIKENQRLETRNLALEAEVRDLKNGDAAIEERARSELGMVGQDETFFQIIGNGRAKPSSRYKRTAYRCKDKDKCILPGFGP